MARGKQGPLNGARNGYKLAMSVGAIGAVGGVSGSGAVYALSPYLNGVVRTSDVAAVAAAQAATATAATIATQTAEAARAAAGASATLVPFANPAIPQIALRADLSGDSGSLVQAYGAVALISGPLAIARLYAPPSLPAIPPVAKVLSLARVRGPLE
jgi:hypothetical protein